MHIEKKRIELRGNDDKPDQEIWSENLVGDLRNPVNLWPRTQKMRWLGRFLDLNTFRLDIRLFLSADRAKNVAIFSHS